MDYLKFVGLSFLAMIIFVFVVFNGASAFAAFANAVGVTVYLLLALAAASSVFLLAKPKHLWLGYAIWVIAIFLMNLVCHKLFEIAVEQNPGVNPRKIFFDYTIWEVPGAILLNPVCYLLGKYLWQCCIGLRGGSMDGRVKPGHGG